MLPLVQIAEIHVHGDAYFYQWCIWPLPSFLFIISWMAATCSIVLCSCIYLYY